MAKGKKIIFLRKLLRNDDKNLEKMSFCLPRMQIGSQMNRPMEVLIIARICIHIPENGDKLHVLVLIMFILFYLFA